jgi:hypothetical protein
VGVSEVSDARVSEAGRIRRPPTSPLRSSSPEKAGEEDVLTSGSMPASRTHDPLTVAPHVNLMYSNSQYVNV